MSKFASIEAKSPRGYSEGSDDALTTDGSGNLNVAVVGGLSVGSVNVQGTYNTTPPVMTNGTSGNLQTDVNGNLKIAGTINASSSATYNSGVQSFTTGSSNALQSDAHGSLLVTQRDASGVVQGALGNPLRVDPVGTTAQPVSGSVSVINFPGTQAVSGTVAISNASLNVVNTGPLGQATKVASLPVTLASDQGALSVSGTFWQATQPVSGSVTATISGTPSVVSAPATTGGVSSYKLVSAASTNATSVKASAGQVYSAQVFNTNATSVRYLKLYDKASAPTVGTDVPVAVWLIPANGSGLVLSLSVGVAFSTGIAFAITGGMADSDTTAVAATEVVINLQYK